MKILAIDVGTGTEDILLYDSEKEIENSMKLVIPSPHLTIGQMISECENEGYFYTSRLLMSESDDTASFKIPLYSVSVTMSGEDMEERYATTGRVFSDASAAIDFYEKAVHNLVTPIDLPYIVEDEVYQR